MKVPAELKVGILVITASAILAVMILFVGQFRLEPENTYIIYFRFTRGLVNDAPVRLAGVEVGRVKALRLIEDIEEGRTKVEVTISIARNIKLRKGTIASISSLGLMGEKYIEINPGPPGAGIISSGGSGVIESVDPVQMEALLRVGEDIVKKLQEIITVANEVVATDEMKASIKNSFLNIEKATEDISVIAADVRYGLDREKFKNTLDNLDIISENLKEFSEDVKENPWKLFSKPKQSFRGKNLDAQD